MESPISGIWFLWAHGWLLFFVRHSSRVGRAKCETFAGMWKQFWTAQGSLGWCQGATHTESFSHKNDRTPGVSSYSMVWQSACCFLFKPGVTSLLPLGWIRNHYESHHFNRGLESSGFGSGSRSMGLLSCISDLVVAIGVLVSWFLGLGDLMWLDGVHDCGHLTKETSTSPSNPVPSIHFNSIIAIIIIIIIIIIITIIIIVIIIIIMMILIMTIILVVPYKAVAEVSKIGNYRRGKLLWCMDGRAKW